MTESILPDVCFGIHPAETGLARLILIKHGESGYHPTEGYGARSEELVDLFNARMGITPAERAAMEFGSVFGWDIPGARAEAWTDRVKVPQREGESRASYLGRVKAEALARFDEATAARVKA